MIRQDSDFNTKRIAFVSLSAAMLGATGMLIFSAAMSLDWSLRLPLTFHFAVTLAVVAAWMAASFADDSEMDSEPAKQTVDAAWSGDAIRTMNKPAKISGPKPQSTGA